MQCKPPRMILALREPGVLERIRMVQLLPGRGGREESLTRPSSGLALPDGGTVPLFGKSDSDSRGSLTPLELHPRSWGEDMSELVWNRFGSGKGKGSTRYPISLEQLLAVFFYIFLFTYLSHHDIACPSSCTFLFLPQV